MTVHRAEHWHPLGGGVCPGKGGPCQTPGWDLCYLPECAVVPQHQLRVTVRLLARCLNFGTKIYVIEQNVLFLTARRENYEFCFWRELFFSRGMHE